ncbi:MAG: anaerobic glycerol-3-phosphate dehydrogenase subunit GlpB [Desulfitobacteriaceae bacterium]
MWDAMIVGGGLAGLVAGIRALEKGRKVLLITEGTSSLTFASGALDFGEVALLRQQPKHPYALLDETTIRQAFAYFQDLCPEYRGEWGRAQELLTPLGTLRKADLVPWRLQALPLGSARQIILVAPEGLKDFFPEIIKANLRRSFPQSQVAVRPVRVEGFKSWLLAGKSIDMTYLTRFWQTAQGLKTLKAIFKEISGDVQRSMTAASEAALETVVVFPGLTADFVSLIEAVLAQAAFPVVEMSGFPPSVHGQALYEVLKVRFRGLGGEIWVDSAVCQAEWAQGECRSVTVSSKGKEFILKAKSFILASGGIFGGGIRVGLDTLQESVFGLPLFVPETWTQAEFLAEQPYAQTGIEVDEELRPIDPVSGEVLLKNVRVVGRTLAHWDPWIQHCGGGVSLASGYLAGELI